VNIFEVGSKNPGATNVRRVLGKGPGNLTFALDALKGAVATGWLPLLAVLQVGLASDASAVLYGSVVGLFSALIGHSFSCFTGFRGGKGVATAAGGLLVLMPIVTLIAALVWVVSFYSTRYVSLASILAAVSLPIAGFFRHLPLVVLILAVVIALFVVIRHRTNIQRLLNGAENRFVKKNDAGK